MRLNNRTILRLQSERVKRILFIAAWISCLAGCAVAPPSQEEIQAAAAAQGFGEPSTINWKAIVKQWFFGVLKDPLSAQYVFSEPAKGVNLVNGKLVAGYLVLVRVNGKNSFGAYIGFRTYSFLFRDNRLIGVHQPAEEQ
jgi:hypothetical protein